MHPPLEVPGRQVVDGIGTEAGLLELQIRHGASLPGGVGERGSRSDRSRPPAAGLWMAGCAVAVTRVGLSP
jgi:hypothetical protein